MRAEEEEARFERSGEKPKAVSVFRLAAAAALDEAVAVGALAAEDADLLDKAPVEFDLLGAAAWLAGALGCNGVRVRYMLAPAPLDLRLALSSCCAATHASETTKAMWS